MTTIADPAAICLHQLRALRIGASVAAALALLACGAPFLAPPDSAPEAVTVAPADVLLLGERHDAPGQAAIVRDTVQALAGRQQLAALVLEMAPSGTTTVALSREAAEESVRTALAWDDRAWPWERYGPVVMTAFRSGVPVLGANLPADRVRIAMADVSLDAQLTDTARKAQQAAVRDGHCGLLPERQIAPMTRVQVARDRSMAHVVAESVVPGRTVVLLAGAGHVDKQLGIPQHLPVALTIRAVRMQPGGPGPAGAAPAAPDGRFDAEWATPAMPARDDCANVLPRPAR